MTDKLKARKRVKNNVHNILLHSLHDNELWNDQNRRPRHLQTYHHQQIAKTGGGQSDNSTMDVVQSSDEFHRVVEENEQFPVYVSDKLHAIVNRIATHESSTNGQ